MATKHSHFFFTQFRGVEILTKTQFEILEAAEKVTVQIETMNLTRTRLNNYATQCATSDGAVRNKVPSICGVVWGSGGPTEGRTDRQTVRHTGGYRRAFRL